MKARPIIKRENRIIFKPRGGVPNYYAFYNGILPNYKLVEGGVLINGDYFCEGDISQERGTEGKTIWIKAMGVCGDEVSRYRAVCRPI